MQLQRLFSALVFASAATAQLLTQGNGNLPACGQSCTILTQAQQQCNGGSSTSLTAWSCFCQQVWTASNGALTTMCASTCTNPSDNTAIDTWYTDNCGSDNGASEHSGGNSGGTGTNNGASSSIAPSSAPSTTSAGGSYVDGENTNECPNWINCHWQWIIFVVVVAIGLLILGFGGRWLKQRHDRKKDRMSEGFNTGITTRAGPMAANGINDSYVSGAADMDPNGGRDSPSRTRDAFMPYGYGYTRSDSRLASYNNNDRGSPLARGATPVNDLEKDGIAATPEDPNQKSRRVMVRERSAGADSSEMEKR